MPKPLTLWTTINCGKFWKRWEYQTTWPASWETRMQVRKQQLEVDMEQQTGSKLEKEDIKAVYCNPAYLTSMQSTSWETLGWKKHKLDSRLPGEISITSDMQQRRQWRPAPVLLPGKSHGLRSMVGCSPWGQKSWTWLSVFTFTFPFSLSCTGEGMATHSSVLAWRIPGMGEPGGLPSMGSHRVGHDWSDSAAAADMHMTPLLWQKAKKN